MISSSRGRGWRGREERSDDRKRAKRLLLLLLLPREHGVVNFLVAIVCDEAADEREERREKRGERRRKNNRYRGGRCSARNREMLFERYGRSWREFTYAERMGISMKRKMKRNVGMDTRFLSSINDDRFMRNTVMESVL